MKRTYLVVIFIFFVVYIFPLGIRPIIIPDESRYAEIPREMIESGDWIVPHLNGLRYFEKPVLGYWINALSILIFGENEFAIRLPSALAGGVSALLVFLLVSRFCQLGTAAIFSAVVFLSFFIVFGIASTSCLDSMFSMFTTAAMVAFFFAYREKVSLKRNALLLLFGAFCGLAFLTKGFIAFAVPFVAIVPFILWQRQFKQLFIIPWLPIVAAFLVLLPWSVAVHLREPDFWRYFFWIEHIKRYTADTAQHIEPWWYFFPVLIGGALPWTTVLPAAVMGMKKEHYKDSLIQFAVCWFIFPFLFFSASRGKLLTYVLPCFAPLAIIVAIGLLNYLEGDKKRALAIGAWTWAIISVVLVLLIIGLITNYFVSVSNSSAKDMVDVWKDTWSIIGFLWCAVLAIVAAVTASPKRKLLFYCVAPLLLMLICPLIISEDWLSGKAPDKFLLNNLSGKAPGKFLLRHRQRIRPETVLVCPKNLVRAVCWFYKRSDVYQFEQGGELIYGLSYDDSKDRLLDLVKFKKLVDNVTGRENIVFIISLEKYEKWKDLIPKPDFKYIENGFVFLEFN